MCQFVTGENVLDLGYSSVKIPKQVCYGLPSSPFARVHLNSFLDCC